jgi:hypothetical protein
VARQKLVEYQLVLTRQAAYHPIDVHVQDAGHPRSERASQASGTFAGNEFVYDLAKARRAGGERSTSWRE